MIQKVQECHRKFKKMWNSQLPESPAIIIISKSKSRLNNYTVKNKSVLGFKDTLRY